MEAVLAPSQQKYKLQDDTILLRLSTTLSPAQITIILLWYFAAIGAHHAADHWQQQLLRVI
jgi:hypothetical protein